MVNLRQNRIPRGVGRASAPLRLLRRFLNLGSPHILPADDTSPPGSGRPYRSDLGDLVHSALLAGEPILIVLRDAGHCHPKACFLHVRMQHAAQNHCHRSLFR